SMTEKKKKSRQFSRSLYVSEDIKAGEVITEQNVRSVRPGYGLHPKRLKDIIGKKATKDLEKGTATKMDIFN
ncbi:MAG: pseudaminic acid synthase, partial [Bacteroidales bacterium]|nr:pseudaminic acid synthase [Bacteroidales bacterium]